MIDLQELSNALNSLRPFKAPGSDGIPNVLLKNLPENCLCGLCDTYNAYMRLNFWPTSFKSAKVIPIPKPGKDKNLAASYRPISLLNTLAKLFEKMIHNRITDFVEEHNILNAEQFGFRPQHSTSHQILRVARHIRNNWAMRRSTGMVLFDIEKAFDSVWHDGLIFKLHGLGFPDYLCAMIREFTSHRSFQVSIFDLRPIPAGLSQGSILSPCLYSIFVSDLKFNALTDSACYADDTAIYSSANRTTTICRRLQRSLGTVEKFFAKWKIRANAIKTQAIVFPFNNRRRRRPTLQLLLEGTPVDFSSSVKYLGVTLDRRLTFREHIAQSRDKAARCLAALYPLIGRRSRLSAANKLLIYKSAIRPIFTYASPVWISAALSNRKQLQVLQSKCLKLIFELPMRFPTIELHERAKIQLVSDFVGNVNNKFNDKCAVSNYHLIRKLAL